MNRLPYHMKRWKGKMSVAILCEEEEVSLVASQLGEYINRSGLVFSFYVRKTITKLNTPYFLQEDKKKVYRENGIFPINFLRLLTIECITTTHYLSIDGDVFVSSSLQEAIEDASNILQDYHNVIVLQLFIADKREAAGCYRRNNCSHM